MTLPNLPSLIETKTNRVVTKHFTNLFLFLHSSRLSLITWLIYQAGVDNRVEYSTHLVNQYVESARLAVEEYGGKMQRITPKGIRNDFKLLTQAGYLWPTKSKKHFLINPMLSYRTEYVNSGEYKDLGWKYGKLVEWDRAGKMKEGELEEHLIEISEWYIGVVRAKLKKKKA